MLQQQQQQQHHVPKKPCTSCTIYNTSPEVWSIFKILSLWRKFATTLSSNFPSHLKDVATLPCKILFFWKIAQTLCTATCFIKNNYCDYSLPLCNPLKVKYLFGNILNINFLRTIYAVLKLWLYSCHEQKMTFCTNSRKPITSKLHHCLQRICKLEKNAFYLFLLTEVHLLNFFLLILINIWVIVQLIFYNLV